MWLCAPWVLAVIAVNHTRSTVALLRLVQASLHCHTTSPKAKEGDSDDSLNLLFW